MTTRTLRILAVLTASIISVEAQRSICHAGSTGFQEILNVCSDLDPEYDGNWMCSKMVVCERFIFTSSLTRGGRRCMETKGCAKEEECTNPTTLNLYDGELIKANLENPGGMTIQPYCCDNRRTFPNDEGEVKFELICNSSTRNKTSFLLFFILFIITTFLSYQNFI